jgi:hypothetical protein
VLARSLLASGPELLAAGLEALRQFGDRGTERGQGVLGLARRDRALGRHRE